MSYMLHIDKIANYFDVSPSYLLRGVDEDINLDEMTENEISLIKMYREMGYKKQQSLMHSAENFVNAKKYEEMMIIAK